MSVGRARIGTGEGWWHEVPGGARRTGGRGGMGGAGAAVTAGGAGPGRAPAGGRGRADAVVLRLRPGRHGPGGGGRGRPGTSAVPGEFTADGDVVGLTCGSAEFALVSLPLADNPELPPTPPVA